MVVRTTLFDPAAEITDTDSAAILLADALETGDAGYVQHVLGIIARAKGMTDVAATSGLGRESLYKALKEDASPKFETVLKVIAALGLQLSATKAQSQPEAA